MLAVRTRFGYTYTSKSAMAKTFSGHSTPKSAMAMAIVAIPVAPPLLLLAYSFCLKLTVSQFPPTLTICFDVVVCLRPTSFISSAVRYFADYCRVGHAPRRDVTRWSSRRGVLENRTPSRSR